MTKNSRLSFQAYSEPTVVSHNVETYQEWLSAEQLSHFAAEQPLLLPAIQVERIRKPNTSFSTQKASTDKQKSEAVRKKVTQAYVKSYNIPTEMLTKLARQRNVADDQSMRTRLAKGCRLLFTSNMQHVPCSLPKCESVAIS